MVNHHEEAPVFAGLAELVCRLRSLLGVAVEEDAEVDDGDAVPTACSSTVTVTPLWMVRAMAMRRRRHVVWWGKGEGSGRPAASYRWMACVPSVHDKYRRTRRSGTAPSNPATRRRAPLPEARSKREGSLPPPAAEWKVTSSTRMTGEAKSPLPREE